LICGRIDLLIVTEDCLSWTNALLEIFDKVYSSETLVWVLARVKIDLLFFASRVLGLAKGLFITILDKLYAAGLT
jgi:hypothetical protein